MSVPASSVDRPPLPGDFDALPGLLRYAVVVRPPDVAFHEGRFGCSRLLDIDHASLGEWATFTTVVEIANFVAVVAADPELARQAARRLRLHWTPPPLWDDHLGVGSERSDGRGAVVNRRRTDGMVRRYGWPNRLRWGERAGWVIADVSPARASLWVDTATPEALRGDLAALLSLAPAAIDFSSERSDQEETSLGRLACDDAAADAALVSRQVGAPVAIWLDADYQRDVDALGLAETWDVAASGGHTLDALALGYGAARPAPAMALLLTGLTEPAGAPAGRPARSPYRRANPVREGDESGRASDRVRVFAEESFLDEWSRQQASDPLDLRLRHLDDRRGQALIEAVRQRAAWHPKPTPDPVEGGVGLLTGRGFAYCHLPDAKGEWESGTRSAWIADVSVDPVTGSVQLTRMVVGQDAGEPVDRAALAAALRRQLLPESTLLLRHADGIDEWGELADASPPTLPAIDALTLDAGGHALPARVPDALAPNGTADSPVTMPLRLSAQTLAPGTAAIANALFDATGQRFREPPFTAARIRAGLRESTGGDARGARAASSVGRRRWRWVGAATASLISLGGAAAVGLPWKAAIDPVPRPAANLYSQATIERGRLVAEAGDCAVCHTASEGGATNVGGRAFETPFGTVYSTNITPDELTGIGRWPYAAFARAMRHGISRDGSHLYPAFPYTAFAKLSDTDLQSLYAYLMAQPAVASPAVDNQMRFPFNIRGLMAGWNLLYHDAKPFTPDPTRSALWNRGAYLAEGAGHCSACHSPRNALGAEKRGDDHFAGALVDGWEAPALSQLSKAPVPWSEAALYDYLRTGRAAHHGVAAGPMAPVVAGLGELPESDVRAIAHYVASFMPSAVDAAQASEIADHRLALSTATPPGFDAGERLYNGACASCHEGGDMPVYSRAETSLALNTNLHSARPDNVIQAILDGVVAPGSSAGSAGEMPGFRTDFSDSQLTALVSYLRARFAPDQPAWEHLSTTIGELRGASSP
ncbi:c-type cytochrome [Salinicola lusitanus]|uniref:c-type cytochrome n=1 Tax=Salinicola lusitanus TaxID=1949085 RepID=UPI000DA1E7FA|nr:c-type cytochrome [Salinicola lusitanus]